MNVLIISELLAIDPQARLAAIAMTPSIRFAWLENSAIGTLLPSRFSRSYRSSK